MTTGPLSQLQNELSTEGMVHYHLPLGAEQIPLNSLLGSRLTLTFTGEMACKACGRGVKKIFQQGYCFPCTQRLAACDLCIVKPELCHFAKGTCREPEWGLKHCMQPHYVYLANASGLKVGVTRAVNVPYRWMDQGATQALLIAKTQSRYEAGLLEVKLAEHMSDKTNWRKMLQGVAEPVDLVEIKNQFLPFIENNSAELLPAEKVLSIHYPVLQYPQKVVSLGFEKTPKITGVLQGIKGQYLLLDSGVLNIRKFTGYQVNVE